MEKKAKPSCIVILSVGSFVLSNIESQEEVVAEQPIAEAVAPHVPIGKAN